ncbi:MAG: sugar kinase [Cyanobacteria bacterium P01_A01_bin.84]
MKTGLFVGLTTLDLIYLADSPPSANQKLVAADYTVAAGGPATNAAIAFSYLGSHSGNYSGNYIHCAKICGVIGSHPMTHLINGDLDAHQIEVIDLKKNTHNPPPVSSIIVTQGTGERAVISINAVRTPAQKNDIPKNILQDVDIVLIDGHQMEIGYAIAQMAKVANIPIVVDGGSWKPGFDNILPLVDYAICSANFYPPGCKTSDGVLEYLTRLNIPYIAITQGNQPIQYKTYSQKDTVMYADVPKIHSIDTLGAGDIFHGAFCHYILHENFTDALLLAAKVASYSCKFFGTRRWMHSENNNIQYQ